MIIRPATVKDALRIAEIGAVMHRDSSFASMAYDEDKTASYLIRLITDDSGVYLVNVVENEAGEVVGGMACYCVPSWFGPDLTASDIGLFLLPEVRGGVTAARLIKAFIAWATERGAKQIRPGVSTGAVGSPAERLYARLGFSRVGSIYCMEAQP